MSTYKCEFCSNDYGSRKILKKHQQTAKFCIDIQKRNQKRNQEELDEKNTRHLAETEYLSFQCNFCRDDFTQKCNLERHYETCKIRLKKIKEENEQKKDMIILKLNEEINKYKEDTLKYKDEINNYKTELLVLKKELSIKDEINQKLEKEIQTLKLKIDNTYNSFFEKEEKLVDTLLHQNNSMSKNFNRNSKTVQNNLTINNYGIKPLTQESVIGAFESYNTKNKNAFNGHIYDLYTGDYVSFKVEHIFYGIIKELKDYYGITDISREKIVFNNNGDMTLTTIQEFIRTNIVMNNINIILEWIMNLQTQIQTKKEEGLIDSNGEIREMTEREKRDLSDKANTLEYVYKMFNISKEKGQPNELMSKFLSEGAMEHGKVVGKVKQLK
jgi:hypothetical protein